MSLTFITGGCRSGKSALALRIADNILSSISISKEKKGLYIATAVINDEEMRQRAERHQAVRSPCWDTFEWPMGGDAGIFTAAPFFLSDDKNEECKNFNKQYGVILFDCLTLWVSGYMEASRRVFSDTLQMNLAAACRKLINSFKALPCPVIMVSNEVGLGIVPASHEVRLFRDLAGEANQIAASCADNVLLSVSGLYIALKGSMPHIDNMDRGIE